MGYGYNGMVVRVDLSNRQTSIEKVPDEHYRKYCGGNALGTYYVLKEMAPHVDAFDPASVIVFASGLLCGARAPGLSHYSIVCKSALTGGIGRTLAGGFFGPELKMAGFDAVVITGKADSPVYILIIDGNIEIRDASSLWGKTTCQAEELIRDNLGSTQVRVACIGPAGEKLVRYACVVNDGVHVNGRCGAGAVMGSKLLKAIAVRGTKALRCSDGDAVKRMAKWFGENFKDNPSTKASYEYGTSGGTQFLNALGVLPTNNFQSGYFEHAEQIDGIAMAKTILIDREGCFACPVRCKRKVQAESPFRVDPRYGGPEYETVAAFGSNCGISNLVAIAKANEFCNENGMDTISAGMCVAFVMECFERGLVNLSDTDGLPLRFGNENAMLGLLQMIVDRRGIGDILAEGSKKASDVIGKGTDKFVLHVKGQEFGLHEPRGKVGHAIALAVSPNGANHMEIPHDHDFYSEGAALDSLKPIGITEPLDPMDFGFSKIRAVFYSQQVWSFYNSLGVCVIAACPGKMYSLNNIVELTCAITGWETSLWELMKLGERTTALARVFNSREGFTAKDDCLPPRMFEPLGGGILKGNRIDEGEFQRALTIYYGMAGWDPESGAPTPEKLGELDIAWAADLLR